MVSRCVVRRAARWVPLRVGQCQQGLEQRGDGGIDLRDRQAQGQERADRAEAALGRAVLMRQPCPQRRLLGVDHRGARHETVAGCSHAGAAVAGRMVMMACSAAPTGRLRSRLSCDPCEVQADRLLTHLDVARRDGPGTPQRQTGTPPAGRGEEDHPGLGVEEQPVRERAPQTGETSS